MGVSKKYVYELNSMDKPVGMMPLKVLISLSQLAPDCEDCSDNHYHAMDLSQILYFMNESLAEIMVSDITVDLEKEALFLSHVFISAFPSLTNGKINKIFIVHFGSKIILVSDIILDGKTSIRMKNLTKEAMFEIIMSSNNLASSMVAEVMGQFKSAIQKPDSTLDDAIKKEEKNILEMKEHKLNSLAVGKFDLKNYQKL